MNRTKFLCPVCGAEFSDGWHSFPIGLGLAFRQCNGDPKHIYFMVEAGSNLSEIIENRAKRIAKCNIVLVDPDEIEKLLWFKVGVPISEDGVIVICNKYLDLINAIRSEEIIVKNIKQDSSNMTP